MWKPARTKGSNHKLLKMKHKSENDSKKRTSGMKQVSNKYYQMNTNL